VAEGGLPDPTARAASTGQRRTPRRGTPPLRADCALFLDIDGTARVHRPGGVRVDASIEKLLPRFGRLGRSR
jgi:hypothetical protein